MLGDAAGIGPRLLGGRVCVECFYSSRGRLGVPRASLDGLLAGAGGRTELFVESYRLAGDPMEPRRRALNRRAMRLLPGIWAAISGAGLEDALRLAALANSVDVLPWASGGLSLEGPAVDRGARRAAGLLEAAGSVAYLLDNAGEAVVDVALALRLALGGARVRLIARSEPYEVDVTEAEARRLLAEAAAALGVDPGGVEVVGTGSRYPAPARGRVSRSVEEAIAGSDAVVLKGIANLEAAMEYCSVPRERAVVLLRAKCPPMASLYRAPLGAAVVAAGYECILARGGGRGA
ncbi:MAG: ARMT1-like domain-containing protein [Desulfurococcales archaeon]|nr:ARMT1-like domain-containing protein [Desulfurococcales archaeon]